MAPIQPGILADLSAHARYLEFALDPGGDPRAALVALGREFDPESGVAGLVFVAFEVQMQRMAGLDDGITDALFRFSRPLTGATYWCPALHDGRLDLRPLGL